MSWPLRRVLQWTWEGVRLFEFLLPCVLDTYLAVGLLDHTAALFLILKDARYRFIVAASIYIPTDSARRVSSLILTKARLWSF